MLETEYEVIIDRIEREAYEELCEVMSPACYDFSVELEYLIEYYINEAYETGLLKDD